MNIKNLLMLIVTLCLFSCNKNDGTTEQSRIEVMAKSNIEKISEEEIAKPGTPEIIRNYPITYRIHGDSMTIYRQYVSEWEVDPETFERKPLAYKTLPDMTFDYRSFGLDSIHTSVDYYNHKLLDAGVITEIEPVEIVLDSVIPFRHLHVLAFKPILRDLRRRGVVAVYPHIKNKYAVWGGLKLNIKDGVSATAVTVYFDEKKPRIRVFSKDTTFDAALDSTNAKLIMGLYPKDSKETSRLYGMDTIGILVASTGDKIDTKEMHKALSLFETDSVWFRFSFERNEFDPDDTLDYGEHTGRFRYGGKPIIYLYPTETTDISVKVDPSVNFTFTYPHYPDSGWRVTAEPSGDLMDPATGKMYYSLFWEGYIGYNCDFNEGFVVSSNNVVSFLEEKLEILGLNYREAQEFILYWAPVLEQNEYSLIHFATDEYAEAVPLTINPEPDTEIRVLMNFKGVDSNYQIPEQQLRPVKRVGYTVVEWGGSNYETNGPIK